MRKLAPIIVIVFLALGQGLDADRSGSADLAIPVAMNMDASGDYVGAVLLEVHFGWLNAPHSVHVTITSDNAVQNEPHGDQTHRLDELQTFGTPSQGLVNVVVPWTTDTNITSIEHVYEVCANVIFADQHVGPTTCDFF